MLGLDDRAFIAHDRRLGAVEAHIHEDMSIARVVQICGARPPQWDAWTTGGQCLYLRYRHGEGTIERYPRTPGTSRSAESGRWDDGTSGAGSASPTSLACPDYD
ncbi:hypothetical protein [Streptomyces uncialis]|uniref:hypothetical protein n=1 Tax=Streptomyces uncialis TaxID=1048205 RepID=UPI0037993091